MAVFFAFECLYSFYSVAISFIILLLARSAVDVSRVLRYILVVAYES